MKPLPIASDLFIQPLGCHAVQRRQVAVEYHVLAADRLDQRFDPIHQQQQQLFAATDLNLSEKWEFNFGVGVGMTGGTDHLIVKMILGRRFSFRHHPSAPAQAAKRWETSRRRLRTWP